MFGSGKDRTAQRMAQQLKGPSQRRHLDVDLGAHDVQRLAGLHLEEVQEVGHRGQEDAARHPDCLGQLPLLVLRQQQAGTSSAADSPPISPPLSLSRQVPSAQA